jgi:uncharacterized membrane-anchored protein YjiN (DUF445 family)
VQNWDSAAWPRTQVVKELQYIAVSGTLVGGFVGMLIFTRRRI